MAQQELKLKISGLFTHPNPLSEVPQGALNTANNIVIDRESIAESRRGFQQFNNVLTSPQKLFNFKSELLAHANNTLYYDNGAGTWTAITGTYAGPSAAHKIQRVEANQNLYLTTDKGVIKLDSIASTPILAGVPAGLDGVAVLGAGTVHPDDSQVAYRIVFGYVDANNNLILGAPSSRVVSINSSGGTRNNTVTFTLDAALTTNYFYQLYRTLPSATAAIDAGDEMYLVTQKAITGSDITNKYISVSDVIPDDNLGVSLYTNVTREGIANANYQPPFSLDLAEFRDHVFFLNTQVNPQLLVQLIANLALGDTVTVSGTVYTGSAAENIAANQFLIGGDSQVTLASLVRVINRSASNTSVYAYISDNTTFFIRGRLPTTSSFTFTSSNSSAFKGNVPISSNTDARQNRVFISKAGQPEAVPLLNYLDVGREDKAILRGISVRDALFVLKEDGIFRITGSDTSNFYVEQHDNTIKILGAETAVALANNVLCMSNQGVVAISVSGVSIISRQIENTLNELINITSFNTDAFGIGYDSDRKYLLAVPTSNASFSAEQIFIYNSVTQTWTRWPMNWIAGIIRDSDDVIYAIRKDDNQVVKERKNFDIFDYADDEFAVAISAVPTASTVTLADASDAVIGYTLKQGNIRAIITNIVGNTLTVDAENQPWAIAAAILYKPIQVEIEFTETHGGNPGFLKHFQEATFLFENARFREVTTKFGSNFFVGFKLGILQAKVLGPWGRFSWGRAPWGGGRGGFQTLRTFIPREVCRGHWLRIRLEMTQAFQAFSFAGVSLMHAITSTKFRR